MNRNYLALGGIIVDDLIYENGNTAMGTIGGGGFYAGIGARIWTEEVSIVARVGSDFDVSLIDAKGLSSQYIKFTSLPTPRAWQILDLQHERTQVPRLSSNAWYEQLTIDDNDLPDNPFFGLHILGRGSEIEERIIERYYSKGTIISYEPIVSKNTSQKRIDSIIRCLKYATIFSPDLLACEVLVNSSDPIEAGRWLCKFGPEIVVVRMGKQGALVVQLGVSEVWLIPACAGEIVNTVGAGNAFCGGFLVGWCTSNYDVAHAGANAAISASFIMEHVGAPEITLDLSARARGLHSKVIESIIKQ